VAIDKASETAEQRIQEALLSGAVELKLNGIGLTELPESLWQMDKLETLDLSDNELSLLPEALGQLVKLLALNLSNNQIATMPEWLGQLKQLLTLKVSNNKLATLPDSLGSLVQLRTLHLSNNQLAKLPDSLGSLVKLRTLHLSNNQLATLPDSLGSLVQLRTLNLSNNRLAIMPEWLGQLKELQSLDLARNRLVLLPESLGQLTQLRDLSISRNKLTMLPESLSQLKKLKSLDFNVNNISVLPETIAMLPELLELRFNENGVSILPNCLGLLIHLEVIACGGNPLVELPEFFRVFRSLKRLYWWGTKLRIIPDWVADWTNLQYLHIHRNHLTYLPTSLATLRKLSSLMLEDNPLNPELAAAFEEGLQAVKHYLSEMAKGAKKRYEAKLLILGDGNEGKTCVSRALRGLPFKVQKTTRGVDVVQWTFPHPDDDTDRENNITLNIWDFEGQEISHQTHQFFLTSQSLYLLVFKCRDQFLMDRAEYWLDTIRARAPKAKVAIVISQCEIRTPTIPQDRIQEQYGDILAEEWFFAVGCENGSSLSKLEAYLQRWAADLEFMGYPWPVSYEKAESKLKAKSIRTPYITRKQLNDIFHDSGVSASGYEDTAAAMARLGVITQFSDCPELRNFVVLRPQWLTKAISKVMEDRQLSEDQGEIALSRMEALWNDGYRGMFATFHGCMKEFELCYDLEDTARSCLLPLRFGYLRPDIPWSEKDGLKTRRIEYKLNIRPPMGIMSRFIVKTHHMIVKTVDKPKGVYWRNGVFLRTGDDPLCSEALCEFLPEDRKLRIEVRAPYPQNMCEQIHAYVMAVFSFFSGLEAERSYGCIKVSPDGKTEEACTGIHTEKRIYTAISKERTLMDCEFEDHEIDPRLLVGGFGSFGDFVQLKTELRAMMREEHDRSPEWATPFLRGIDVLRDWSNTNEKKLEQLLKGQAELSAEFKQEAELKFNEYLALTSQMLDDRDFAATPGLIGIRAKDRSKWNPTRFFEQTYVLVPYCECERNVHACENGSVEFTKDRTWWRKTAPWIARGTKLLATGLQLAFAGMPLALGAEVVKSVEDEVKFMEELTKHMELQAPSEEDDRNLFDEVTFTKDLRVPDKETAIARASLARFLEETAPNNYRAKIWGSLRRIRMPDNSYRWLCEECAKQVR